MVSGRKLMEGSGTGIHFSALSQLLTLLLIQISLVTHRVSPTVACNSNLST